jgi:hypothetical protein
MVETIPLFFFNRTFLDELGRPSTTAKVAVSRHHGLVTAAEDRQWNRQYYIESQQIKQSVPAKILRMIHLLEL